MSAIRFEITARSADCAARTGRLVTPHGAVETPVFMPVGTQASVKGLLPQLVAGTGARIILGNTYHLLLRPGHELVAKMGGLHRWMNWNGSMLTDSGGFQVFSLSDINRIDENGVTFKSHLDGRMIELTPERSMQAQNDLGADVMMAFDECPPAGETVTPEHVQRACERTIRWLKRCVAAHARPDDQALFGIVQGGTDLGLRSWCAKEVTAVDLPGYAIGGVAVGESFANMKKVVEHTAPLLPVDRPRYLMGVGYERDIVMAVRAGVDMFDCVLPTRNGRNASAFTRTGQIRLRNAQFADDPRPIEEGCDCVACCGDIGLGNSGFGLKTVAGLSPQAQASPLGGVASGSFNPKSEIANSKSLGFSRSYLRHLFAANEMLGPILVSLHNVRHFQRLLLDIRRAIADNGWSFLYDRWPCIQRG